jgi:iron complex outermembrane receptor protein
MEAGVRFEVGGLMLSAAYFHIDRALTYTNAANVYVADGKAIHRGVEASVQGELGRSISLLTSAAYLDAQQREIGDAWLDGRKVINTPRYTASLFIEYRPPVLEGFAVNGGAFYTGRRSTDVQERAWLPAYTTYSVGARQRVGTYGGRPLTLQVNFDNLTNKRYWSVGGSVLYVGLPRTARASLKYEF